MEDDGCATEFTTSCREFGKGCRVSKWAAVSRLRGAGFGCGTRQWLCCALPTYTDVSRWTRSCSPETGERVRARQDGRRITSLRTGTGRGAQHPTFLGMFRKSTGETPHQFVLRLRVERAKEMLRSAE